MKYPLMRNNIIREDLDAVIEHLKTDDPKLTNGPKVREFEEQWSSWLGVKHSVFVNSGASANLLSMAVLKLRYPEGGEVIVPPLTWISDIASVLQNGFTPIFVDINRTTLAMDSKKIIDKLNSKTRAVFLTHAQGFNGLTDQLISELKTRKIPLIEDVCESHGVTHNGKKAGSIGWISNFSFYYAHHMSTIEGGMICTNDDEVYEEVRMLRSHGMVREANNQNLRSDWIKKHPDLNPDFIFAVPGYNVRNTEIGGILGISQLKRLDKAIELRTRNLKYFLSNINSDKYFVDFKIEGSSNYAFNLILKNKDDELVICLMNKLDSEGVEYRRGSAGGGNQLRQPYLKGFVPDDHYKNFPETDHVHFYGFYIGNFPDLAVGEVNSICEIINSV
jgi:CDP-4-dehydro-6-deoxyglucose reductase, E1